MRAVRDVGDLYTVARRRIIYVESLLPSTRVAVTRDVDRAVAFASIELLNCWAGFSRSLYFSACFGARDASGASISTSVNLRDGLDAQLFAAQRFTRRSLQRGAVTHRDEPNWLQSSTLITLLNDTGASNLATVSTALAGNRRVLTDLPSVRNFFGHRGQDTARKAAGVGRNYGKPAHLHPAELCVSFAPGRPQSIIRDWAADLRDIMKLAAA